MNIVKKRVRDKNLANAEVALRRVAKRASTIAAQTQTSFNRV